MFMKAIGAAIVGCGRISDLHEPGYRGREDAHIVAVCDTNQGRARGKAKKWGVSKIYTKYWDVLKDPEVDLVELLTPHHMHCEMTVAACRAGKHVSVQKPVAMTLSEADQMMAAAAENGVQLRVYENFVFYEPAVKAREMICRGEIGELRMIRIHVSTGTASNGWEVPLSAWLWRFNQKKCGGGPLVFDHGYHLFSIALHLMGPVEKVSAWIDRTPVAPAVFVDAPATFMFQFKAPRCYGVMDIAHTPQMRIDSQYYADDDRIEIIGEKGIIMINRYTAKTIDLPELMVFKDGKTTAVPVQGVEWHDSFIACTQHMFDVLHHGEAPRLSGQTGKDVLQFALAALISAERGRSVNIDEVELLDGKP
jgi:predicted dehydrogenase